MIIMFTALPYSTVNIKLIMYTINQHNQPPTVNLQNVYLVVFPEKQLRSQLHCIYAMLPDLDGVPASTVQADGCWTVSGEQQIYSSDHILSNN